MPSKEKEFSVKIYDNTGEYIKTLTNDECKNTPRFSSQMNGITGPCELVLQGPDYTFNDFDEGESIAEMNIVEIYEAEAAYPDGRMIYRGFISKYAPFFTKREGEGVLVTVLSAGAIASADYYRTVGGDYAVAHESDDPEAIARACIDHLNTIFGGSMIFYDNDSTDPVGVNVTKEFVDRKWIEVLQEIQEKLAGGEWWWAIDPVGKYFLKDKPAAATHEFVMGEHVDEIRAPKSAEEICNHVQVRYSTDSVKDYEDTDSKATHGFGNPPTGRWADIISDSTIGDEGSADQAGEGRIAKDKDGKVQPYIIINNTYDIETIKVGDTFKIKNIPITNTFFSDNMQIVGVTYSGDQVTIEVGEQTRSVGRQLEKYVYPSGR